MEDNTSTESVQSTEQPSTDPILNILTDTEDTSESESETSVEPTLDNPSDKDVVDETIGTNNTEDEAAPEASTTEDNTNEELQPELDKAEIARRRYEERQLIKAEREQRILEQTKEYVSSANDDVDQRLRNMEIQSYNQIVSSNEDKLVGEFERVVNNPELQIFNPDSDEFNQKAYAKAIKDFNAGYIEYDTNGNMVSIKGSLYEHLKETSELLSGAVKSGAIQQVRATKRMKSEADIKPAAQPKEQTRDVVLDILKSDD